MTTQAAPPESVVAPSPYKILVAMSFDPTADAALAEALNLVVRSSASELHVAHAVGEVTEDRFTQAKELLGNRLESAWRKSGGVEVIAHIRPGDPAEVIMQTAIDIDADVVIVGSHRRAGLPKLVLGSVAERVLHGSHCPVLIAFPKDYSGATASPRPEPPCAECLAARKSSANATFWCARHSKPYLAPHIYVPRDDARLSVRIL